MSLLGNGILRCVLARNLYTSLQNQRNAVGIIPQKMGYSSTVWTSMDVAPTTQTVENKIVKKINKSARFFMEKAQEYDEMIQEADHEYKIGMRHLANMMGEDPENFSQEDANVAIEYLFPSGIYDKKARPFMRRPIEVFPQRKKIQFDITGRPHHYLFFTGSPNYYAMLHEATETIAKLNKMEDKDIRVNKQPNEELQLNLSDSAWLTKEQLEEKLIEKINDKKYADFIATMERLLQHPYSYECKETITKYRKMVVSQQRGRDIIEPKIGEDGRKYVTTYENRYKSCIANVTVISPGTGSITINGKESINYFEYSQPKETVSVFLHVLLCDGLTEIKTNKEESENIFEITTNLQKKTLQSLNLKKNVVWKLLLNGLFLNKCEKNILH